MVAALGLGKFYGSGLPRPRFYSDVKLNGERVDPPLPVMDPLLAWAEEAHWSMGGASMTRRRLQGRIEGNVNKLRVQRETLFKKSGKQQKPASSPAPRVIKRRRVVGLVDEEEEVVHEVMENGAARKLGQNFGRVAGKNEVRNENDGGVEGGGVAAVRKKDVDLVVVEAEPKQVNKKSAEARRRVGAAAAGRTPPRLAKIGRSR